ncbi:MAG: CBS domain-containing protein [Deltaproteobacteria bacterium]|nr:CBS domain-containing protein [Deltaproteobacteria bacterium]
MEFTKKQELIYNLPIEHVMRKNIISVTPETTIRQLKEILKTNRISGAPVLDDGRLVGIVSIEDLIKALEAGELDVPVGLRMTKQLITVLENASIVEAIRKFSQFHIGRLLVVNEHGDLTGILTGSDITRGLLEAISLKEDNKELKRRPRIIFREDIISDQTSLILRYHIKERDFKSGGSASSKIKRAMEQLGISPQILRRVAICAYEAEMNLIIHTDGGGDLIVEIEPDLIRMTVADSGPGIADVEQAMSPGFSTAPTWIQELGFGAGMGLANIKRCADSFTIESDPGSGTVLNIVIHL